MDANEPALFLYMEKDTLIAIPVRAGFEVKLPRNLRKSVRAKMSGPVAQTVHLPA